MVSHRSSQRSKVVKGKANYALLLTEEEFAMHWVTSLGYPWIPRKVKLTTEGWVTKAQYAQEEAQIEEAQGRDYRRQNDEQRKWASVG